MLTPDGTYLIPEYLDHNLIVQPQDTVTMTGKTYAIIRERIAELEAERDRLMHGLATTPVVTRNDDGSLTMSWPDDRRRYALVAREVLEDLIGQLSEVSAEVKRLLPPDGMHVRRAYRAEDGCLEYGEVYGPDGLVLYLADPTSPFEQWLERVLPVRGE